MRNSWLPTTAFILTAAVIAYAGCSTNSAVSNVFHTPPPPPPTKTSTPTPMSTSMTVALVGATALPVPMIGGFSGTFMLRGPNPPPGAMVVLTSYLKAPAGAPAPLAIVRIPTRWAAKAHRLSTTPTAFFWVSQQYSTALSFTGFPITTWTVPASDATPPLALETFDGTTNTLLDTEFDTGISGNVATFPGSSTTFAVVTGHTYWWELISGKPTPVQITSGTPPGGEVSAAYSGGSFPLGASGGTPPYSWSWSAVAGSSTPPGLNVVGGAITGTPTTAGTYQVVVTVTDAGSPEQRVSANYSITIAPPMLSATEYPIPTASSHTTDIVAGPDGNLWFTEDDAAKIGKVTTSGLFSEAADTASGKPSAITVGPDANLWFVHGNEIIGQITPTGAVSGFSIAGASAGYHFAQGIAAGPDGNLWITDERTIRCGFKCWHPSSAIDVMSVSGTVSTSYVVNNFASIGLGRIVAGSDGNLWFVELIPNKIGKITTSGVITEYSVPTPYSGLNNILALGPDGNIWFCENGANQIGRITPAGSIREFPIPSAGSGPFGIGAGPDGNVWFTEFNVSQVGRVTPTGTITEYTIPTFDSQPIGITKGPDGDVWFAETGANKIAKFNPSAPTLAARTR